jgi:hypothetical protein
VNTTQYTALRLDLRTIDDLAPEVERKRAEGISTKEVVIKIDDEEREMTFAEFRDRLLK